MSICILLNDPQWAGPRARTPRTSVAHVPSSGVVGEGAGLSPPDCLEEPRSWTHDGREMNSQVVDGSEPPAFRRSLREIGSVEKIVEK